MKPSTCTPEELAQLTNEEEDPCPRCGYSPPEDFRSPRRPEVDICINCGALMAAEEVKTPAPVMLGGPIARQLRPAGYVAFSKISNDATNKLLDVQAATHKAARTRGYDLHGLKFRTGRA